MIFIGHLGKLSLLPALCGSEMSTRQGAVTTFSGHAGLTLQLLYTKCVVYTPLNVTSAGWQVTLCDPMWHVSSRSGVATLRTAIHLLLICYLLSRLSGPGRGRCARSLYSTPLLCFAICSITA